MAVRIQDGGLFFDSGIDLQGLEADANKASGIIAGIGSKVPLSQFQSLNLELGKVQHSIETLRAMKLARENFLITETDLGKIAKYRKEITALEIEIARLSNVGKTGFDSLGNPIKNIDAQGMAAEGAAKKTNLLAKSWGFLRQAAYLIPGIGIAGIFNLIGEGAFAAFQAIFKGKSALDAFAKSFETFKQVVAEANREAGKQIADLDILYRSATNANLSLKERKEAVEALKAVFPDFFKNINEEIILQGKATQAYKDAKDAIIELSRAKAAKGKIDELEAQRLDIQFQKQKIQNATDAEKSRATKVTVGQGIGIFSSGKGEEREAKTQVELEQAKTKIQQIEARKRTALAEQEKKEREINDQEAFLKRFIGEKQLTDVVIDNNKNRIDAYKKEGNELLSILEERKNLLDQIAGKERDAFQSGLVKEQSIVDKVKESYELLIKKVEEFNEKVKKKGVPGIDINPIKQAENLEVSNTIAKQQAEEFIKSITSQKAAFDDFEKYKLSVGPANAKLIVAEEIRSFDNYIDFLQAKLQDLADDQSVGGLIKKDALSKELEKARADKAKRDADEQAKNLREVLSLTSQFDFARNQIDQKYFKLRQALEKAATSMTIDEYQKRSDELDKLKQKEINDLNAAAVRQSEFFKKLGEDLLLVSRDELKRRLNDINQALKDGFIVDAEGKKVSLTPKLKEEIKAAKKPTEDLIIASDKMIENLDDFIEKAGKIKPSLDSLANALEPFNSNLAESVRLTATLLGNSLQVAEALKSFQASKDKSDIVGQFAAATSVFSAVLSAISTIVNKIKDAVSSVKQAKAEIADFNDQLISGEIEYQQLLRERERQIILNNKLTIDGIIAQSKLLSDQRKNNQQVFDDILAQIQKESFVVAEKQGKKSIFNSKSLKDLLGGSVQSITESLAGKTFDQLEELFVKGQLTGKAKELFEQLRKIKEEGADIDQLLEDNKKRAAEIFTGTTAESITDSIADGFKNGLHTAADFASTFEDFMRGAIFNSLKFKYLEPALKDFFDQFADASQSGGQLTGSEIDNLKKLFNTIITNTDKQLGNLEKIAGIDLSGGAASSQNVLTGSFHQLTEDTGNQLLGAFNGQRIATLQLLDVQKSALNNLNNIERNTADTVTELKNAVRILSDSQTGFKRLKVEI